MMETKDTKDTKRMLDHLIFLLKETTKDNLRVAHAMDGDVDISKFKVLKESTWLSPVATLNSKDNPNARGDAELFAVSRRTIIELLNIINMYRSYYCSFRVANYFANLGVFPTEEERGKLNEGHEPINLDGL